ncbi:hypothetical protein F2Q69_00022284 [Brassica cretica]|uniref:Uncharacterized protein n=1 Tax=Brassica cretica TaxID=69181 RepID=A0A8S9QEE6_BRACR|nr:hypothetical protein F2Q69_00022284 [Brassica cretica]
MCVLGRYVATEFGLCEVRWPYLSLSVADLDTCSLPPDNRYLVREDYELSSRNIRDLFREFSAVCKVAGFLKTLEYWPRDKFWDLVSGFLILFLEMLETSVLGLGQDLGLITALGGAMTTSTYVSRIVFDLIPSHFKVRDMFSAYVTCMVGIEHLFEDNF